MAQPVPIRSCIANQKLFIALTGSIDSHDKIDWNRQFENRDYSDVYIILNSSGGRLLRSRLETEIAPLAAEDILETIKELKRLEVPISASLRANSVCQSACTLILAAIDNVFAHKNSKIGFHSAWYREQTVRGYDAPKMELFLDQESTNKYLALLMTSKIDPLWVLEQKNRGTFSKLELTDFNPEDLVKAGFVDSIMDTDSNIPCELE